MAAQRQHEAWRSLRPSTHLSRNTCSSITPARVQAATWPSGDGIAARLPSVHHAGSDNYGVERNATILLRRRDDARALGLTGGSPTLIPVTRTPCEATRDIYAGRAGTNQAQPMSLLYPVDREAMQVLYRRLDNGDDPRSFGPWSSTSLHIHGNAPRRLRGRDARTATQSPGIRLSAGHRSREEAALSGSVTWAARWSVRRLARPRSPATAEIAVNIGTLTGSRLLHEPRGVGREPAAGSDGIRLHLGRWRSRLQDLGARQHFRETGGDAGRVTGIFTGRSHEGAAGTLERSDLTAAFGADEGKDRPTRGEEQWQFPIQPLPESRSSPA